MGLVYDIVLGGDLFFELDEVAVEVGEDVVFDGCFSSL